MSLVSDIWIKEVVQNPKEPRLKLASVTFFNQMENAENPIKSRQYKISSIMKNLFTLLFLMMGVLSALAKEMPQLVIQAKDGTKVSYLLKSLPQITFAEDEINISSNEVVITYSVSQTSKCFYETIEIEPEEGLVELQTDKLQFHFDGNAIIFPSLKSNSRICLYTVTGGILFTKSNIAEGEYLLSLDNLASGTYIVNVNEITCKIIKQ